MPNLRHLLVNGHPSFVIEKKTRRNKRSKPPQRLLSDFAAIETLAFTPAVLVTSNNAIDSNPDNLIGHIINNQEPLSPLLGSL